MRSRSRREHDGNRRFNLTSYKRSNTLSKQQDPSSVKERNIWQLIVKECQLLRSSTRQQSRSSRKNKPKNWSGKKNNRPEILLRHPFSQTSFTNLKTNKWKWSNLWIMHLSMTMALLRKLTHHILRDMLKQRNSKINLAINHLKGMATSLLGQITKLVKVWVKQESPMISNILVQAFMNTCQLSQTLFMTKKTTCLS